MLISKNSMKKIQYRLGSIDAFFRDIVKNKEISKDDSFIDNNIKNKKFCNENFIK